MAFDDLESHAFLIGTFNVRYTFDIILQTISVIMKDYPGGKSHGKKS